MLYALKRANDRRYPTKGSVKVRSLSDALAEPTGDINLRMEILAEVQSHLKYAQDKTHSAAANAHYEGNKYKAMADRDATIAGLHVQIAHALMSFGTQVEILVSELNRESVSE